MIKITKIEKHEIRIYKFLDNYSIGFYLSNIKHPKIWYWIDIITSKKDWNQENCLVKAIYEIKKVKVKYQNYLDKKKSEQNLFDLNTETWKIEIRNFWKSWKLRVIDLNNGNYWFDSDISEEYKNLLCYSWGSELQTAKSFSDITVIDTHSNENITYVYTSEVIEVLERWLAIVKRWNNPEEQERMIAEYEKNGKIKE